MAAVITFNQNKGSRGSGVFVIRATATGAGATDTIELNGTGLSANSVVAETVSEMSVASIQWTTTGGALTLDRNATEIFRAGAGTSGDMDFASNQMRLEENGDLNQNLVVTFEGSSTGTAVIKMHKSSGA